MRLSDLSTAHAYTALTRPRAVQPGQGRMATYFPFYLGNWSRVGPNLCSLLCGKVRSFKQVMNDRRDL